MGRRKIPDDMHFGCKFKSISGDIAIVKEYRKSKDILIQFEEAQNVYKETKESNLKFLAEKYKNVLHNEIYDNLINYKVGYK